MPRKTKGDVRGEEKKKKKKKTFRCLRKLPKIDKVKVMLHKKFKRMLLFGKARFNILRAALWRKQAEGSMDALIREEKRGRGERVDSPRTKPTKTVKKQKKPGILLRVTRRARGRCEAKVGVAQAATAVVQVQAEVRRSYQEKRYNSEDPPPEESLLQFAKMDAKLTKRKEAYTTHVVPTKRATDSVFVELSAVPVVQRGACLVSSCGVEMDATLHGWRLLTPGSSAIRFEFALDEAATHCDDPLELRLREFRSPWAAGPSLVDVRLNGELILERHAPDATAPATHRVPLQRDLLLVDSNLLQVKLCREASPWAYLLKSICVATPEVERAALELSEVEELVARYRPPKPPHTPSHSDADRKATAKMRADQLAAYATAKKHLDVDQRIEKRLKAERLLAGNETFT